MSVQIQTRRDTAANWTSTNPVLALGEAGLETDTGKIKYGDGSTAWSSLAYGLVAGKSTALETARNINGVAFDGSADITVTAAADTLTGTSGMPVAVMANKSSDATVCLPIIVYVKSLTVKTTGTPADIGTITVPSNISRYWLPGAGTGVYVLHVKTETSSGTLAAASFTIRDQASGAGNALTGSVAGPGAPSATSVVATNSNLTYTASTLYVYQTASSANAGTCSFYLTIMPMP